MHPAYQATKHQWRRCRDAFAGQDAVKARKESYLPKTSPTQSDAAYDDYLARATWFNAFRRTVQGFSGMIWRKPASIDPQDELDKNVTGDGHSLDWLLREVVREVLVVSRAGVFVDRPDFEREDGVEPSLADIQAAGIRPYMRMYKAEDIWDWDTEIIAGRERLSYVKIYEHSSERNAKRERVVVERVRELILEQGTYTQIVHVRRDRGQWTVEEERVPAAFNGFIPFWFMDPVAGTPEVDTPILIDLVDTNFSHYRLNADLRHGLHFTALPTPWATGVDIEEMTLGPDSGLVSPNEGAQFGMLEFTGSGLSSLSDEISRDEHRMAVLGARMLMSEKRAAETAEAAQIHRAGEDSILASIANSVSESASEAYRAYRAAAQVSEDADVELNTDFLATDMDPQMLMALLQSWQLGALAFEDLVERLKAGEVLAPHRSATDIRNDREAEPPPGGEGMI